MVQPAVDRGDPAAAVSIASDVVETPPGEPAVHNTCTNCRPRSGSCS